MGEMSNGNQRVVIVGVGATFVTLIDLLSEPTPPSSSVTIRLTT